MLGIPPISRHTNFFKNSAFFKLGLKCPNLGKKGQRRGKNFTFVPTFVDIVNFLIFFVQKGVKPNSLVAALPRSVERCIVSESLNVP